MQRIRAKRPDETIPRPSSPPSVLNPLRQKQVRVVRPLVESIRTEHQVPPVRAEHGEAVELLRMGDALESGPVQTDHVDLELAALRILVVRAEEDPLPVRMPVRREVRTREVGDLPLVRAVRVHDPDIQVARPSPSSRW